VGLKTVAATHFECDRCGADSRVAVSEYEATRLAREEGWMIAPGEKSASCAKCADKTRR
jgi:ribosomal protein L37E